MMFQLLVVRHNKHSQRFLCVVLALVVVAMGAEQHRTLLRQQRHVTSFEEMRENSETFEAVANFHSSFAFEAPVENPSVEEQTTATTITTTTSSSFVVMEAADEATPSTLPEVVNATVVVFQSAASNAVLTKSEMDDFKSKYDIKADAVLTSLSLDYGKTGESTAFSLKDTTYNLSGLTEVNAFASGVTTHYVNGVEQSNNNAPVLLWEKKITSTNGHMLVTMMPNMDKKIDTITITTLGEDSVSVVHVKEDIYTAYFSSDVDYEGINADYTYGSDAASPP